MIPHNRPTLGDAEAAAARALASGWVAAGPEVARFEAELGAFFDLGADCAAVVSSGSAALFLALQALGRQGEEVAMPVYACAALSQAARLAGQTPIFVDCLKDSPSMDPAAAASTPLAVSVATFGVPAALPRVGRERLVLDLAQAPGALHEGRRLPDGVGCATLSFSATKLLTSGGQGGAIVSRDQALIAAIRDYLDFDDRRDTKARFNFRMGDVQAAIGRSQLRRLDEFFALREERLDIYRRAGLDLLAARAPGDRAAPYRAVMRAQAPRSVIEALERAGARAITPIETAEFLADPDDFPNARALARSTVSLPLYPTLSLEGARMIAAIAAQSQ